MDTSFFNIIKWCLSFSLLDMIPSLEIFKQVFPTNNVDGWRHFWRHFIKNIVIICQRASLAQVSTSYHLWKVSYQGSREYTTNKHSTCNQTGNTRKVKRRMDCSTIRDTSAVDSFFTLTWINMQPSLNLFSI